MKLIAFSLLAAAAAVAGPTHAADVGVSIGINQPGFYGRVDIGRTPAPPVLVYEQPVLVAPPPVRVERRPIYLHVPPGHSRDWKRYCGRYQACGQPVYFVQDRWYRDHYARPPGPYGRPDKRHHGRDGDWRDGDGRGRGHDDDRGPGRGHGRGHGHGRD